MANNSKEIMILRHAKAEAGSPAGDFARRLTEAGREHARRLGMQLHDQRLIPQSVYSSTALRAIETASLVCEQMAITSDQIVQKEALYLADVEIYLSLLQQVHPRITRVMLVGHNPVLEDLVDYLSRDPFISNQPSGKRLLPATLITLRYDGDWPALAAHSCNISHLIHGKFC